MNPKFTVAVVDAASGVGTELLRLLLRRRFPLAQLRALGTEVPAGETVEFGDDVVEVEPLDSFDFAQVQIALFAGGARDAQVHVPRALDAGCMVIDHSGAYQDDEAVPLVVPEVNPHALEHFQDRRIVASPAGAVVQLAIALKPLHDMAGIVRINVVACQSVSGSGRVAIEALARQSAQALNGMTLDVDVFPKQIAFNLVPQVGGIEINGHTEAEMVLARQVRRVMEDDTIGINATCVTVPVFHGDAEAVHLETRQKLSAEEARRLLSRAPGVVVLDERCDGGYPTPVTEAAQEAAVFIGRIREDLSHPRGLNLWVVADNVRRGAALNGVQIAELLVQDHV